MNISLEQKSKTVFDDKIVKPEVTLILCCSRTRLSDSIKKQINLLVKQGIDWQYLISLAHRHSVLPLLFNSLNSTCPESIPLNILTNLRSYFQSNAHHNLFISSKLVKISNIFQGNGINAVPFKGPSLAISVYGNPSLRQFCDLDILVQHKDFTKAKKLLLSHEYYLNLPKLNEIFVSNHAFQTPFHHSSGRFSLDLHWGVAPRRPRFHSRFNCLWNDLGSISIGTHLISSFSQESTLVIQCINATKEPYRQSLKQICDINEIIQTYPNLSWDIVLYQARKLGCRHLVLIALYLTQMLYETSLPTELMKEISSLSSVQKLAKELRQSLLIDDTKSEANFDKRLYINKYNFQTIELRDKFLFSIDKIITPHSEDRQFISLSPLLYYLYYLIRPIRLIISLKTLYKRTSIEK